MSLSNPRRGGGEGEDKRAIPATSQIYDDLCLRGDGGRLAQEITQSDIDNVKSQMIPSVDERRSSLKFLDKKAKEVRLVWIVKSLHAPLRANRTVVCLDVKINMALATQERLHEDFAQGLTGHHKQIICLRRALVGSLSRTAMV